MTFPPVRNTGVSYFTKARGICIAFYQFPNDLRKNAVDKDFTLWWINLGRGTVMVDFMCQLG